MIYINIWIQKPVFMAVDDTPIYERIKKRPAKPAIRVMSNCAVPHIIVSATDEMRAFSFTNKIRPKYSPIRFGVKKAIVAPLKMDPSDLRNEIGSTALRASCHLRASSPQFTNIKRNAVRSFQNELIEKR